MVMNQLFDNLPSNPKKLILILILITCVIPPPPPPIKQSFKAITYLPSSFLKRNVPANTGINNLLNW